MNCRLNHLHKKLSGPTHIAADDTVIRGKVTATYTYGKPVNGQVVLKFAVDNKSQKMYSGAYHFKELTTELVDGEAAWEVNSLLVFSILVGISLFWIRL